MQRSYMIRSNDKNWWNKKYFDSLNGSTIIPVFDLVFIVDLFTLLWYEKECSINTLYHAFDCLWKAEI